MKKTFMLMLVAILLGGISGKFLFSKYEDTEFVFNEGRNLYFLQEGVYSTKESMEKNTKDITPKLVIPSNSKYYVYVGITSDIKNAKKIKEIYTNNGYSVYQKEIKVNNLEFINSLEQFDALIKSTKDDDILTIEEVILSNYENLIS